MTGGIERIDSAPHCQRCGAALNDRDQAAYGEHCEDCFASQRTHGKHFKTGGDKMHSSKRQRGHGLRVKRIL